jgi:cation:H+ antiporter
MMLYQIAGGVVLLFVGGDILVRGAVALARRLGVSPLLIGLTIVGFGTSTPELVTSVQAALVGSPGISIGNVVGSNIVNILFILGLTAMLAPIAIERGSFLRDGLVLLASAAALYVVVLRGALSAEIGWTFVAALGLYVVLAYFTERRPEVSQDAPGRAMSAGPALVLLAGGLAATIFGARLLVEGALALARNAGLSETLIGLTIVAVGTSLPELAASLVAVARRQSGIAFGNILGSNIYNTLGILGVTGIVRPLEIPAQIASFDIWAMVAASVALVWFAMTGARLSRLEGFLLVLGYGLYIALLLWRSAGA